jgi:acetoin utilization deacetylase AcuC-like enzyme
VAGKDMKVFWNSDYTNISHDFDTSRKSNNIVALIKENQEMPSQLRLHKDIPNVEICDPYTKTDVEVTESLINSWLTKNYAEALRTNNNRLLSESQGFRWCPNTYAFARAHAHGLIASVDEVKSVGGRCGSLSSGLHHASMGSGAGFCTINGIALSAIYAHEQGFEPIILDFDAHCGGGTMNFLNKFNNSLDHEQTPIQHIDMSTNHFDSYESDAKWSYLNVRGINDDYLDCIKEALEIARPLVTDKTVFIYNAGIDPMDAYEIDQEVIKQREKLVSNFIGDSKAIFALAGGYSGQNTTRDDVAKTHLYNIYGWAWSQK